MKRNNRICWIDVARGIVMVLVVFGHVMRQGRGWHIVNSFHVPTFFVLSGMLCHVSKPWIERLWKDFLRIMIPYYIWGCISILVFCWLGPKVMAGFGADSDTSILNNLLGLIYASPRTHHMRYNAPLWFLPALFITKTICCGASRLTGDNAKRMLLLSIPVSAIGFLYSHHKLPPLPFYAEGVCEFLPFFMAGYLLKAKGVGQYLSRSRDRWFRGGMGIVILIFTCRLSLLFPKVNCASNDIPDIPAFFLAAFLGCAGILLLSSAILSMRWAEVIGVHTLSILVMHKFPVVFFQVLPFMKGWMEEPDTLIGNLIGMGISILVILMCLMADAVLNKVLSILRPFLSGKQAE